MMWFSMGPKRNRMEIGVEATFGIIQQTIDEWIQMGELESEILICPPIPALTFEFPQGKYQNLLDV